jgi:hypothetical protein
VVEVLETKRIGNSYRLWYKTYCTLLYTSLKEQCNGYNFTTFQSPSCNRESIPPSGP